MSTKLKSENLIKASCEITPRKYLGVVIIVIIIVGVAVLSP
jgi:hypothetical protein